MRSFFVAGVLALGLVQACSVDSTSGTSGPVSTAPDNVSQVVGPSGGTVATPDGNATVDIPEGALPENTTITIQANPSAPPPASAATVGTPYTFGPDGLKFLKPVQVTIGFDPSKLPSDKAASSIVVFTAPDGSTTYEQLPTSVKDATHVLATTTHFSTDVAGVTQATAPTDAGTCYATCTTSAGAAADASAGGGGGGTTSTVSCDCAATCDGVTYEMSCTDTSCTCKQNGVTTGTVAGQCGQASDDLAIYNTGCNFPGVLPPPPDCVVTCGGSATAADASAGGGGSDGGVSSDGGASTSSCDCQATCNAHTYAVSCSGDACDCMTDGVSTKSGQSVNSCSLTTYNNFCGYPGSYGTTGSDGGTQTDAGSIDASADGGSSGGSDGGAGGSDGGVLDAGGPVDAGPG